MQDAVLVSVVNRTRHLGNHFYCAPSWHWLAIGDFIKLAAFDELHAEVALAIALAYFVNRHDARMLQARRGFCF